ncbi:hypothetical protein Pan153_10810 [Gimesia panareensis]|uniref:Uncharacterized protein n=1 Tax=Gimesia panareensis TaxID=2527978 RepID=A0A518FJB6_9PLAN|nr:AAA family ATPase [Gimesia panareensis]QDV16452.1 hypothetical protein Pan153_10810 [Gimesia panareensis]
MIKSIKLKFGSAPGNAPVVLDPTPVTIFVGPNNSGKSIILNEIQDYCNLGISRPDNLILDQITFKENPRDAHKMLQSIQLPPRRQDRIDPERIFVGRPGSPLNVQKHHILSALENPNTNPELYCNAYLCLHTLNIGAQNRTLLIRDSSIRDPQGKIDDVANTLFYDDHKREVLRGIIHRAFGNYIVFDPTSLGQLKIRLSETPPKSNLEERGFHDEAVQFHQKARRLENYSDGVKAFTGILSQIIAGDPKIILIDEPEAFLAPTLSFILGKEIAFTSNSSNKQLFVSTHSASFIMGCIQTGVPVNIVRLTYQNDIPTARTLPNEKLIHLMRNPLLRSTGVLEGLFYEFVIVTEADSDRAFYEEINERLLQMTPDRGIPNCLFLNAQNKQTVHQIVKPLRELGIPTAGIVDVDILKNGGKDWSNFMNCGFIPGANHLGLGQNRSEIYQKCKATGKCMKRDGGIDILSNDDKEAARNLFKQLADYGLFVVESGELESWLQYLGVPKSGHGPSWLIEIFEKMGEDPDNTDYVSPDSDDVWAFIDNIAAWFKNPERKGIPN